MKARTAPASCMPGADGAHDVPCRDRLGGQARVNLSRSLEHGGTRVHLRLPPGFAVVGTFGLQSIQGLVDGAASLVRQAASPLLRRDRSLEPSDLAIDTLRDVRPRWVVDGLGLLRRGVRTEQVYVAIEFFTDPHEVVEMPSGPFPIRHEADQDREESRRSQHDILEPIDEQLPLKIKEIAEELPPTPANRRDGCPLRSSNPGHRSPQIDSGPPNAPAHQTSMLHRSGAPGAMAGFSNPRPKAERARAPFTAAFASIRPGRCPDRIPPLDRSGSVLVHGGIEVPLVSQRVLGEIGLAYPGLIEARHVAPRSPERLT